MQKRITKEGYEDALRVIKQYEEQLAKDIEMMDPFSGITVIQFFYSANASTRLRNQIKRMLYNYVGRDGFPFESEFEVTMEYFVENFTVRDIYKTKTVGIGSLNEFLEVLEEHNLSLLH